MIRTPVERLRVAVLAGGDSAERSVSLASGRAVAKALIEFGHDVTCWDPVCPQDQARIAADLHSADNRPNDPDAQFRPVVWNELDWQSFDSCFLALHGGAGEDGRLQQHLERCGACFTGPSAAAARLAMSKIGSKQRFVSCGVPTPDYYAFDARSSTAECARGGQRLGYPLVVKPNSQGSSLGTTLVDHPNRLAQALQDCLTWDEIGLMESFVAGPEFTVAMIDDEPLPVVPVGKPGGLFTFADKYDATCDHAYFPADTDPAQAAGIVATALAAARALETRGLVRADLRVDAQGEAQILELNAIPGLTDTSLAPAAARRAGWSMPEFCDLLVRRSLLERGVLHEG